MRPIHLAQLDKTRPVVVLTRERVRPHMARVTVAYTAAAMLAGDTNGGGMPQIPRGVAPLPYLAAIAVLTAIAVVVAVVAALTTVRRDIT